jgi:hypothetical protein
MGVCQNVQMSKHSSLGANEIIQWATLLMTKGSNEGTADYYNRGLSCGGAREVSASAGQIIGRKVLTELCSRLITEH